MAWNPLYHTRSISSLYDSPSPPPSSPMTSRDDRARIYSSPHLESTILPPLHSERPLHALPSIRKHDLRQHASYVHSSEVSLPSFRSLFGTERIDKPLEPEVPDTSEVTDEEELPSRSSAYSSASDEELEADEYDFGFGQTSKPVLSFRMSSERGRWKTDPIPMRRQPVLPPRRASEPMSPPPLPVAITRPSSVPTTTETDVVSVPAGLATQETVLGHTLVDATADAPIAVHAASSDIPDLTSSPVIPSSLDLHEGHDSPLPPSSPPMSSSPMLQPMSPLTMSSPLTSTYTAYSSPLSELPSEGMDVDMDDFKLSDDSTPPTSPELRSTEFKIEAEPNPVTRFVLRRSTSPIVSTRPTTVLELLVASNSHTEDPVDSGLAAVSDVVNDSIPIDACQIDQSLNNISKAKRPVRELEDTALQARDSNTAEFVSQARTAAASSSVPRRRKTRDVNQRDQPPRKKPRKAESTESSGKRTKTMRQKADGLRRTMAQVDDSNATSKPTTSPASVFPPPPIASCSQRTPEEDTRDSETRGMLIECMATSRATSLAISTIYKTLIRSRPALKAEHSEKEWCTLFEQVLEGGSQRSGVFGKVESSYSAKDDSDKQLEARWFYVPERDEDQERATLIRSMMPAKRSETKKYKQYYYRPLAKISRWDPEDAI